MHTTDSFVGHMTNNELRESLRQFQLMSRTEQQSFEYELAHTMLEAVQRFSEEEFTQLTKGLLLTARFLWLTHHMRGNNAKT